MTNKKFGKISLNELTLKENFVAISFIYLLRCRFESAVYLCNTTLYQNDHLFVFSLKLNLKNSQSHINAPRNNSHITNRVTIGFNCALKTDRFFVFSWQVKLTGSHLSQQIYAMISYMQSTQNNEQVSMNASTATRPKDKKKSKNIGKV